MNKKSKMTAQFKNQKSKISEMYHILLSKYSYQGWWPLSSINGYHPQDYSYPKNLQQTYEISLGAILTQNTSWKNVEKALINLYSNKCIDPNKINECNNETLRELIKPTGFFNQKTERIKIFTNWFLKNINQIKKGKINRKELLSLKGIGKETADSILLYALKQPIFIIDTYTKRIMSRIGVVFEDYDELQQIIQTEITNAKNSLDSKNVKNFKKSEICNIYQEYHALLVEHAKQFCKKKPICVNCPLNELCEKIDK